MGKKAPVEFKGTINGLYLIFDEDETFETCFAFLNETLKKMGDFYKGSSIIGLKGMTLSYKEKYEIEQLFTDVYNIDVISLEAIEDFKTPKKSNEKPIENQPAIEEANHRETVRTEIQTKEVVVEKEVIVSDTKFVYGTLRSGSRVEFKGNVIVIGDVNPGSEVIAAGNIIVFGKLLGFVHAGASGDDEAFVVSNYMAPTQIRISKYISVPPKDDHLDHGYVPEKAFVNEGIIKIQKVH